MHLSRHELQHSAIAARKASRRMTHSPSSEGIRQKHRRCPDDNELAKQDQASATTGPPALETRRRLGNPAIPASRRAKKTVNLRLVTYGCCGRHSPATTSADLASATGFQRGKTRLWKVHFQRGFSGLRPGLEREQIWDVRTGSLLLPSTDRADHSITPILRDSPQLSANMST